MSTVNLIFEKSTQGKRAITFPKCDVPEVAMETLIPQELLRQKPAALPEVSEIEAVRHFTQLSRRNHGVDVDFYPLGSCTMKYNPKVNEQVAKMPGVAFTHPLQPAETAQGNLKMLHTMEQWLCEVTGMDRMTFQPAAGAHGELTGILLIKAYHESRGDIDRRKVIVPDSAHGTNPATAAMAGFEVVSVKSNPDGTVDLASLKDVVGPDTAALMMTNPSTMGLFDPNAKEIAAIVHKAGGLVYYDGANTNAIMGYVRPGDMGFDVIHLNLHKTFSTPHGGGGPGSGPVGVKNILVPFLPVPVVEKQGEQFVWDWNRPQTIGKVHGHYGNFGVVARAYAYCLAYGPELKEVSEYAVLNANYIMAHLRKYYDLAFDRFCMHECVLSAKTLKNEVGVKTLDIAKRLLDEGVHPPTIYFPMIVEEALMVEPTETEDKATLDRFIDAMVRIYKEAKEDPERVKSAPHTTVVGRLDEAMAARKPNLRYRAE
ncbi:MAG TPA: aminomethyl-transferring glycine dehydrogenase subunit GcvPB [Symbiobacteriaceae bacterium]|nr:aminomethyl-transferring glycine dehydrogenase subunit GcvPB [Symbiobacteriaceae bacterium]